MANQVSTSSCPIIKSQPDNAPLLCSQIRAYRELPDCSISCKLQNSHWVNVHMGVCICACVRTCLSNFFSSFFIFYFFWRVLSFLLQCSKTNWVTLGPKITDISQTWFSAVCMSSHMFTINTVALLVWVGWMLTVLIDNSSYRVYRDPLFSLPFINCFISCALHSYAKIHIPIIASVSEHQPTTWVSFFFDLHILVCTFPAGLWFCIKNINDERVFGKNRINNFFPLKRGALLIACS